MLVLLLMFSVGMAPPPPATSSDLWGPFFAPLLRDFAAMIAQSEAEDERMAAAIRALSSDAIEIRDAAVRDLIGIGEPARAAVERLAASADDELRGRALQVLRAWKPTLALEVDGPVRRPRESSWVTVKLVNRGLVAANIPWPRDTVRQLTWEIVTIAPGKSVECSAQVAPGETGLILTYSALAHEPTTELKSCGYSSRTPKPAEFPPDVFTGTLTLSLP